MKLLVDKSFERDTKKLPIQVKKQLKELILALSESTSFQELNLSKIKGSKNAYRIRLGNYRIGIYVERDHLILSRILNRKDIYRYFPKK